MSSSKSAPVAPSEVQKSQDLLNEYLGRQARPPSREVQEKRARLLKKLSELVSSALGKG
jgi:hypothetical protein